MLIATSANITEPNHIYYGTVPKAYRITNCGPHPVQVEALDDVTASWGTLNPPAVGFGWTISIGDAIDVAFCQLRVRSAAANQVSRVWIEII